MCCITSVATSLDIGADDSKGLEPWPLALAANAAGKTLLEGSAPDSTGLFAETGAVASASQLRHCETISKSLPRKKPLRQAWR